VYSQCVSEINKQTLFRAASKWKKTQLTEDHDYAAKYDCHLDDKRAIEAFNYNPGLFTKSTLYQFNGLYLRTTSMQRVLNDSTAALYPFNLSTSISRALLYLSVAWAVQVCHYSNSMRPGSDKFTSEKMIFGFTLRKENWYKKPFIF